MLCACYTAPAGHRRARWPAEQHLRTRVLRWDGTRRVDSRLPQPNALLGYRRQQYEGPSGTPSALTPHETRRTDVADIGTSVMGTSRKRLLRIGTPPTERRRSAELPVSVARPPGKTHRTNAPRLQASCRRRRGAEKPEARLTASRLHYCNPGLSDTARNAISAKRRGSACMSKSLCACPTSCLTDSGMHLLCLPVPTCSKGRASQGTGSGSANEDDRRLVSWHTQRAP